MKYVWLISAIITMSVGAVYLSKFASYLESRPNLARALFAGLLILLAVMLIWRNSQ